MNWDLLDLSGQFNNVFSGTPKSVLQLLGEWLSNICMLICYVLISDANVNPQSWVYVALRHDERRQPGELRRVPLQKLLDGLVKGC